MGEAMFEELRALKKNKTWDLVKLPAGKKVEMQESKGLGECQVDGDTR